MADVNRPFLRAISTELVDLTAADAKCIVCRRQALLYALDMQQHQWLTCLDHHGLVVIKLIRGELDQEQPPLP